MSRYGNEVEKEQFWRLVLEEHASSGLSVRAWDKKQPCGKPGQPGAGIERLAYLGNTLCGLSKSSVFVTTQR